MDARAEAALAALVADLVTDAREPRPPTDSGIAAAVPVEQVRRHLLGPLAFHHGDERFRKDYATSSVLVMLRDAALREAVTALGAAGIPVIPLKGASYIGTIYPDPALRPMSDVDLLVRPADHPGAAAALRRLGYWHAGTAIQLSPWHHALALKRQGSSIDLHRHIVQVPRAAVDLDALWTRSIAHEDGTRRLDPVDEMVFHLAHMARHELAVPLVNFVDAGRLWRRLDDAGRRETQLRAAAWRMRRMIEAALVVVSQVLGPAISPPLASRTGAPGVWWLPSRREVFEGGPTHRLLQVGRKALLVDGPSQFIGLALATARSRWFSRSSSR